MSNYYFSRNYAIASSILLLIFSFGCSPQREINKISKKACSCGTKILSSDVDNTTKKIQMDDCLFGLDRDIKSAEQILQAKGKDVNNIRSLSYQKIEKSCKLFSTLAVLHKEKRKISDSLSKNPSLCKEFLTDGNYRVVGSNVPIEVVRKGNLNIARFTDLNCETIYKITWVNECSYYLELIETDCEDFKESIGLTIYIRIIEIIDDTIHYDLDAETGTYPQIMRKVE